MKTGPTLGSENSAPLLEWKLDTATSSGGHGREERGSPSLHGASLANTLHPGNLHQHGPWTSPADGMDLDRMWEGHFTSGVLLPTPTTPPDQEKRRRQVPVGRHPAKHLISISQKAIKNKGSLRSCRRPEPAETRCLNIAWTLHPFQAPWRYCDQE